MRSNYIASKMDYENFDGQNCTLEIDGKTYHWNGDNDPEYQNDGVLDISYWELLDDDDDTTDMVLAFYRLEDVEDPQEWSDEYDADCPVVLIFK